MENNPIQNLTQEQIAQILMIADQYRASQTTASSDNKPEWFNLLQKEEDKKGKEYIIKNADNIIIYLNNHPKYKGQLKYNDYTNNREIFSRDIRDEDVDLIRIDLARDLGYNIKDLTEIALTAVFEENHYNPVIDYFESLKWDEKPRCETLFIDTLGVEDNRLNREMTYKWLLATVKRQLQPGCKFDSMIILQGAQSIGKTTVTQKLAKMPMHQDVMSMSEISDKDTVIKLSKNSIIVVDEMDCFEKKEIKEIKTFITTTSKSVRCAYGHYEKEYLRHCTFIGSTNESNFLRDSTTDAERRFWVMKCLNTECKVYDVMTDEYIDQIWAEAYYKLKKDFDQQLWLSADLNEDFRNSQQEFKSYNSDDAIDLFDEILNRCYNLSDGSFTSLLDFEKQAITNDQYSDTPCDYIQYIPIAWLNQITKKKYGYQRSGNYLIKALPDWEYKLKKTKVLGKPTKCLVRKKYKESKSLYGENSILNMDNKSTEDITKEFFKD